MVPAPPDKQQADEDEDSQGEGEESSHFFGERPGWGHRQGGKTPTLTLGRDVRSRRPAWASNGWIRMSRTYIILALVRIALATAIPLPAIAETKSTGTGFAVSFDGIILTNEHVVEGCSALKVHDGAPNYFFTATVVARDAAVDLAAIRLQTRVSQNGRTDIGNRPRAIMRAGPDLQVGELAVTYGFPLRGILATDGSLAVGYVTALRGLRDNPNYMQISTPLQPGNSGGPLLDSSGNVIGVAAMKLNALAIMRATGTVPENVNFAVELGAIKRFLAQSGISAIEDQSDAQRPVKDIGMRAKLFTYLIECDGPPAR